MKADPDDIRKSAIEDRMISAAEDRAMPREMSIETANGRVVFQHTRTGSVCVDIYLDNSRQFSSHVPAATALIPQGVLLRLMKFIGGMR